MGLFTASVQGCPPNIVLGKTQAYRTYCNCCTFFRQQCASKVVAAQFGEGSFFSFLFQDENATIPKVRSTKKCFSVFGVEELAQSPDLNPIPHFGMRCSVKDSAMQNFLALKIK